MKVLRCQPPIGIGVNQLAGMSVSTAAGEGTQSFGQFDGKPEIENST
jgi:hypothetical protein